MKQIKTRPITRNEFINQQLAIRTHLLIDIEFASPYKSSRRFYYFMRKYLKKEELEDVLTNYYSYIETIKTYEKSDHYGTRQDFERIIYYFTIDLIDAGIWLKEITQSLEQLGGDYFDILSFVKLCEKIIKTTDDKDVLEVFLDSEHYPRYEMVAREAYNRLNELERGHHLEKFKEPTHHK